MISPFTIYLIMMLDEIKQMFGAVTFVGLITLVVCGMVLGITEGDAWPGIKRYLKWMAAPFVLSFLLWNLLPTPKVAAAMYIIPAIANNENVQREASELYDLAKQGLKNLVTPDEPAREPQR